MSFHYRLCIYGMNKDYFTVLWFTWGSWGGWAAWLDELHSWHGQTVFTIMSKTGSRVLLVP